MRILVTGGTGMLGHAMVPVLVSAGHDVTVLSRRGSPSLPRGVTSVRGNVISGDGLESAATGAEAVIHAATSPVRRSRMTELEGTRNVVRLADRIGAHFVYISIVGVSPESRFPYYRTKAYAERIVEETGRSWTIQRATQFHELLDRFLRLRVFPTCRGMTFQLVDPRDLSGRLVRLLESGPAGRAADFGGPEVLGIGAVYEQWRAATGRHSMLMRLPPVGPLRDFATQRNICAENTDGRITWSQWLAERDGRGGRGLSGLGGEGEAEHRVTTAIHE